MRHTLEKLFRTDLGYLVRSGFWLNANFAITSVLSLGLSVLMTRVMSKSDYGSYQLVLSAIALAGAFAQTGMATALTKAVASGHDGTIHSAIRTSLRWGTGATLAGFGFALFYLFRGEPVLAAAIGAASIGAPFISSFALYGSFLIGKKDFKGAFAYAQIFNALYYGTVALLVLGHTPLLFLVIGSTAAQVFALLLCTVILIRREHPSEPRDPHTNRYGRMLSLTNILSVLVANLDNMLVFHVLGPIALAGYAIASTIPERLFTLLKFIPVAALPRFSGRQHEEVRRAILPKTLQLGVVAAGGALVYIAIAPLLFHFAFPAYTDMVQVSSWYVLVSALSLAGTLPTAALAAHNPTRLYISTIATPLLQILFLVLGAYSFGLWGIVWAKIAAAGAGLLLGLSLAHRPLSPV